ncbi:hypothetical protein PFISCL1PPCAC_15861, partial [Pristionchus fissidentatus]
MDLENEDRFTHPFSPSCGHLYCNCNSCWLSHISESIHAIKLPAACLNADCCGTVSVASAKSLLNSSSLELYEQTIIDALKSKGSLISCPECKKLHFTARSLHISCSCGSSLCSHCSSVNHFPLGCDAFEQYNTYMKKNDFVSVFSTSSETPIISDLVKCPKCCALMQKSEGCNHMRCKCGSEFCYQCGKGWTSAHYGCKAASFTVSKIALVDVFTSNSKSLLVPSLLAMAIAERVNIM